MHRTAGCATVVKFAYDPSTTQDQIVSITYQRKLGSLFPRAPVHAKFVLLQRTQSLLGGRLVQLHARAERPGPPNLFAVALDSSINDDAHTDYVL